MSVERIYTVREVVEMERCTTQMISDACRAGEFPGAYRNGRAGGQWRIPESSVKERRRQLAERARKRQEQADAPFHRIQDPGALVEATGMSLGAIVPLMPRSVRRRRLLKN